MPTRTERVRNGLVGSDHATRTSIPAPAEAEILRQITARLDPVALGISLAVVCGAMLLLATNVLVLAGGQEAGRHLALLSQYLPGYRVTPVGSLIGAAYAAAGGFVFGWLAAYLRGVCLNIYLWMVRLWADLSRAYFLDRLD